MFFYRALGLLLIILGIVTNEWVLETYLVLDGEIGSVAARAGIVIFQLALVVLGLWFVFKASELRLPTTGEWILVGVSVALAFAAAEVFSRFVETERPYLRAYVGQFENRPSQNMAPDPNLGWRMKANHRFEAERDGNTNVYRSNAQGFRSDRDFDPPAESMIALVGDSFTWGSGVAVEETFGHVLETESVSADVYNFALPGFGIDQMWMTVRHEALPRHPELIVVAFIHDDFYRSLTAYRGWEGMNKPRFVLRDGKLEQQTRPSWILMALQARSAFWNRILDVVTELKPFEEYWSVNLAILDAIAADAKEAGVPVLFLRLPQKYRPPLERLREHLKGANQQLIDIGGPDAVLPDGIHLVDDGHMSPAGHRFVAGTIREWISAHTPGLVKIR